MPASSTLTGIREAAGERQPAATKPPSITMYQCVLVLHLLAFLRHPWVFSRALGCGARRGAAWYTTAQVWVPGGLRGACSGRSKSRNLASSRGVAFRGARAEQDNGKPIYIAVLLHCCKALYFAATVQQQSHIKFVWTTTMRVWTLHMRVCSVCYDTCAGTPHISFLFLLCLLLVAAAAAVSCPYHTVPHALKLFTL